MTGATPIAVTVLTGYLGSGKTTLLRQLLEQEGSGRIAVLINEFGEISLDDLMVRDVVGSNVVLQNGCICCSVRSELQAGLRDLLDSMSRGTIPEFDRVLVETTGLADPVPIVQTLVADPMLRHRLRLAHLVSTVDALNGVGQLTSQDEALRQAATADRLVVTKTDLADEEQLARLLALLAEVNPRAPICQVPGAGDLCSLLLSGDVSDPLQSGWDIAALDRNARAGPRAAVPHAHADSRHGPSIRSFVVRSEKQINWTPFAVWLSLMVHRHGRQILRVKGLLDVPEANGPVLLNAVQHFIHPPVHLDEWPSGDRTSRLVFIVQDLEEAAIRRSMTEFLAQAEPLMPGERAVP
ncbi:MAG: GTP-binding protein [Sneathiellaceae bacterium]